MPNIDLIEASTQDAFEATPEGQQALLKNAVQNKYFALVSEGTSPNSAAANAIRTIGAQLTQVPGESTPLVDADVTAPRRLRFEGDEDVNSLGSSLLRSNSAPGLSTGPTSPAASLPGNIGPLRPGMIHRNKDMWKTFGIHLPAGRSLKRLYGGAKLDPVPGSLQGKVPKRLGPPSEMDTYMAVNNMKAGTIGLQYRKSMNIFDLCPGAQECVRWGDAVEGYRVDAAWLQVGDRYLPTTVNKVQLLTKWKGAEALRLQGLRRQTSLPALRGPPKESINPQLSVGGVPYGF